MLFYSSLILLLIGYALAYLWELKWLFGAIGFAILVFCVVMVIWPTEVGAQTVAPTRDERTVEVTVEWHDNRASVIDACYAAGAWPGAPRELVERQRHVGCAFFYPDTKACTVHVLKPQRLDDDRTTMLGHEVLHCFKGRYH